MSGLRPRANSDDVTVSSSVSTAGPSARNGMCGRCQLGGARAFQQHRVGEPLDALDIHPGGRRHLLDGCAGADAGLNFLGTQHAGDLDVDMGLTHPGSVAAQLPPSAGRRRGS